jgi:hypothetical protein
LRLSGFRWSPVGVLAVVRETESSVIEGFEVFDVATTVTTIHGCRGGDGPPVLLLHGIPETHLMWRRVAPALAQRFTVVANDLRGYGDSGTPPSTPDHTPYRTCLTRGQTIPTCSATTSEASTLREFELLPRVPRLETRLGSAHRALRGGWGIGRPPAAPRGAIDGVVRGVLRPPGPHPMRV